MAANSTYCHEYGFVRRTEEEEGYSGGWCDLRPARSCPTSFWCNLRAYQADVRQICKQCSAIVGALWSGMSVDVRSLQETSVLTSMFVCRPSAFAVARRASLIAQGTRQGGEAVVPTCTCCKAKLSRTQLLVQGCNVIGPSGCSDVRGPAKSWLLLGAQSSRLFRILLAGA